MVSRPSGYRFLARKETMMRASAIGIGVLLVILACGIGPNVVMAQGQLPQKPTPTPPQTQKMIPGAQGYPGLLPQGEKRPLTHPRPLPPTIVEYCDRRFIQSRCEDVYLTCSHEAWATGDYGITEEEKNECDRRFNACHTRERQKCRQLMQAAPLPSRPQRGLTP